ncbi:MAG: zinc-dependent metalloprotease [Wenzhouxiangellaceae bacterium]
MLKKLSFLVLAGGLLNVASAQFLAPDLFNEAADNRDAATGQSVIAGLGADPSVTHIEFIGLNSHALASGAQAITLNLGRQLDLIARVDETYALDEETIAWSGTIDLDINSGKTNATLFGQEQAADKANGAVFVVNGERVHGQIDIDGLIYEILTVEEGGHYLLVQRDFSQLPDGDDTPAKANPLIGYVDAADEQTLMNTSIRVLQFASVEARNQLGGSNAAKDRMRFFLAQANRVYANNGIQARLANAGVRTPNISQNTNNADTLLNRLTNGSDGFYDQFAGSVRNNTSADLVGFITADGLFFRFNGQNFGLCGIADAIAANANQAFFLVNHTCTNFTFVHEIGHLFGARHDNDPTTTPFAFGHGFVNNAGNFRTVMAVNSNPQPRIGFFSTDDQRRNGQALGNASFADNERVHQQRRGAMSRFR